MGQSLFPYWTWHPELLDLRGNVMDGDRVADTFAVGSIYDEPEAIEQEWEFLVVYMEQGPQALPRDIYINASINRSWRNQYVNASRYCGSQQSLILLITAMCRLVMKTCKDPVWPPEIEAESLIEPNNPCVWGEPADTGNVISNADVKRAAFAMRARRLGKRLP